MNSGFLYETSALLLMVCRCSLIVKLFYPLSVAGCEKAEKPGSDTNVQGQESTSSDQNPSGITTTFCPSDSGGGIGNGGSDGDGDGNEPNNTDTSISNGHYVETPVSLLEQGTVIILPR